MAINEDKIKSALQRYNENRLGTAIFEIRASDYTWHDFFARSALRHLNDKHITLLRSLLQSSLRIYKWKHGKHPKYTKYGYNLGDLLKGSKHEPEKPVEEYTEKEFNEMDGAEPWQCFPFMNNNIDVFYKLIGDEEFSSYKDDSEFNYALALLVQDTPRTADNFKSLTSATLYLAASLYGEAADASKLFYKKLSALQNSEKTKIIGDKKKAGKIRGEQLRRVAHERNENIKAWIKSDLQTKPERGLAKRISSRYHISVRKARAIIKEYKAT